jgi:hypothetical protein
LPGVVGQHSSCETALIAATMCSMIVGESTLHSPSRSHGFEAEKLWGEVELGMPETATMREEYLEATAVVEEEYFEAVEKVEAATTETAERVVRFRFPKIIVAERVVAEAEEE